MYLIWEPKVYDKEWIYRQLQSAAKEILDCAYYGKQIDLRYNLGKYFNLVNSICVYYNTNIDECLGKAYLKIMHRKGKTINGKFVKET